MSKIEGSGNDYGDLKVYPTQRWRCDSCGKWMSSSEAAVQWELHNVKRVGHQIVHRTPECSYNPSQRGVTTHRLDDLIGFDGLVTLLACLEIPGQDIPAMNEIIRRIQVPRYESVAPWISEMLDPNYSVHEPDRTNLMQENLESIRWKLDQCGWEQPATRSPLLRDGCKHAKFVYREPKAQKEFDAAAAEIMSRSRQE